MSVNVQQFIKTQLEAVWTEDAWIVPISRALADVTAKQAAWQPPGEGDTNSIWQLVNHMNYYNDEVLHRLKGISIPAKTTTNTSTFGEVGDPQDEAGWQRTREHAFELYEQLQAHLSSMQDEDYVKEYEGRPQWKLIARWISHDSYHNGQIVLIRKLQNSWPTTIWP
ncbi:putative damage-inducible protein DinB [Paenibacillus shirakamiensis]|uniref:Damage-inducible protein DinB n=1 Tax=Paenibacillus shirakamiensis TaxID=1265935 RepID=A0ABS4JIG4_9BACL|nr:DinB family protein [Paenibacillus shirakamiensis]MBP2000875.1 putative damage-inducible protein DinB [Paenibacillus shirakamiensis]